jgi:hypothetical protein
VSNAEIAEFNMWPFFVRKLNVRSIHETGPAAAAETVDVRFSLNDNVFGSELTGVWHFQEKVNK